MLVRSSQSVSQTMDRQKWYTLGKICMISEIDKAMWRFLSYTKVGMFSFVLSQSTFKVSIYKVLICSQSISFKEMPRRYSAKTRRFQDRYKYILSIFLAMCLLYVNLISTRPLNMLYLLLMFQVNGCGWSVPCDIDEILISSRSENAPLRSFLII